MIRHLVRLLGISFTLVAMAKAPAFAAEKAPGLEGGAGWLNVERPITLSDLRGKVVLLDFWTFCCINCMHVVPDLQRLEEKYGKKLVVIGVHSAKFENEKESDSIRQAILRYGIAHPVVNDASFEIWKRFGASAWPSFVLIDPEGNIAARTAGEGQYALLDAKIAQLISTFSGKLDERELPLSLEKDKQVMRELAFPGKILADGANKRLFVSDTGNNRIVVTDLSGELLFVIGSGKRGREDGSFAMASFDEPQGLALRGETLYVADRRNHSVRSADLTKMEVRTVAGTGRQGYARRDGRAATDQDLSSPWDLSIVDNDLYVAMAGWHQIWRLGLGDGIGEVAFGNGREDIVDGKAESASLAQPSGLSSSGRSIFFADSEVSAIRKADLVSREVTTLIGEGLFDFGDVDGQFGSAKLQHPLGVAHSGSKLYAADSYNHKIKELDLEKGTIRTIAGGGSAGFVDGTGAEALFSEPSGLSFANKALYVADTNNHSIRRVDLETSKVETVRISLPAPTPVPSAAGSGRFLPNMTEVQLSTIVAGGGSDVSFRIALGFEPGYHLNPDAPSSVRAFLDGERASEPQRVRGDAAETTVALPRRTGRMTVEVEATLYYCKEVKSGVCLLKSYRFVQPIEITSAGPEEKMVELEAELKA